MWVGFIRLGLIEGKFGFIEVGLETGVIWGIVEDCFFYIVLLILFMLLFALFMLLMLLLLRLFILLMLLFKLLMLL